MARKRQNRPSGITRDGQREALPTLVNPQAQTTIDAIFVDKRKWRRNGPRPPSFLSSEAGTQVFMGNPDDDQFSAIQEERAWQRVLSLDDTTAQTFVYVMARCIADAGQDPSGTTISVNELLDYRGLSRNRKRDFDVAAKIRERQRFADLSALYVSVRVAARGRRKQAVATSPLLDVTVFSEEKGTTLPLKGLADHVSVPYEFKVRLGFWSSVNPQRRAILTTILSYAESVPSERYALRLGLALHHRPSRVSTVRELMEYANIPVPTHHVSRFRDDFELALELLARDQIIDRWEYIDADEQALPKKGAFEVWSRWRVRITEGPHLNLADRRRVDHVGQINGVVEAPAASSSPGRTSRS